METEITIVGCSEYIGYYTCDHYALCTVCLGFLRLKYIYFFHLKSKFRVEIIKKAFVINFLCAPSKAIKLGMIACLLYDIIYVKRLPL